MLSKQGIDKMAFIINKVSEILVNTLGENKYNNKLD